MLLQYYVFNQVVTTSESFPKCDHLSRTLTEVLADIISDSDLNVHIALDFQYNEVNIDENINANKPVVLQLDFNKCRSIVLNNGKFSGKCLAIDSIGKIYLIDHDDINIDQTNNNPNIVDNINEENNDDNKDPD